MFKRVERKRKRQEEEEELGLDQDLIGLESDTNSDESDSGLEQESAPFDTSDADLGIHGGQEADTTSEDEDLNGEYPISVAEALKDPIYLVSLDPNVHGCVLCKGKLIKNAGMASAHRNANAHKRRLEHFRLLSASADPNSNAWKLIGAIRSKADVQRVGSQAPSKRALKRQAKQAALCEKRKRHKELKAKAMAKKASRKLSEEGTRLSEESLRIASLSRNQLGIIKKKQKLQSKTSTGAIMETQGATRKSVSRTRAPTDSKKSVLKNGSKNERKAKKPS